MACHWRVSNADGDYSGGPKREDAVQRRKELGGKGRIYKSCSKPGSKPHRGVPTWLQWALLGGIGVGAYFLLRKKAG